MISISIWKIFLIVSIALIVLGPDQLLKIARSMGRLVGYFKRTLNKAQQEMNALALDNKETLSPQKSAHSKEKEKRK